MEAVSLGIAFVTDGESFSGDSPERQALGGSETALVQLARALAARGHRVRVYCRCPQPGIYQGVEYFDRRDLVRAALEERFEVLVVSRFFTALDLPIQAGLRVLWNHDILDRPRLLAERLDELDLCLVLSRFHAQNYVEALPACQSKLTLTRNGLDLKLMERAARGAERSPKRVMYVSRPERGLLLLLEKIWPRLKAELPHLELEICGYKVDLEGLHPSLKREYAEIERLCQTSPGVRVLGGLAKEAYYRRLASSACLLYPCVFPEISCIAALETQALATPILTSDGFALSETVVEPSFLVPGEPGSPEYVEAYVARAMEMLSRPGEALVRAERAAKLVRAWYDWAAIARQWEDLFLARLDGRIQSQTRALAAGLLLSGDGQAASDLLGQGPPLAEEGQAPPDPDEAGLLHELTRLLGTAAKSVGVVSADGGRTARELAGLLPGAQVRELDLDLPPQPGLDAVLIRDRLEREADPARLLGAASAWCASGGRLLLCVASGAWPLVAPGHLGRRHHLGKEELAALLPGRLLDMSYLPRGLVGEGAGRLPAGRWLVMAPAHGVDFGRLDKAAKLRRARPAPHAMQEELSHAGLL